MSIYSSLTISRKKAMELILNALANADNETLKEFAFAALEAREYNRYNIYMIVDGEAEDDEKVTSG